jgi:uncharacterized lipoprotein YajG
MKKYIAILSLLAIVSCAYTDQKIKLSFDLNNEISQIGRKKEITVYAVDKRQNKELGQKTYAQNIIVNVFARGDVAKFVQNKVAHNLISRGFQYGDDKKIEIQILKLSYNVRRSFIASADIFSNFRVIVYNKKGRALFDQSYVLEQNNKYFIMPKEKTVATSVNNFVKDSINIIVNDPRLIRTLRR